MKMRKEIGIFIEKNSVKPSGVKRTNRLYDDGAREVTILKKVESIFDASFITTTSDDEMKSVCHALDSRGYERQNAPWKNVNKYYIHIDNDRGTYNFGYC